MAIFKNSLRDAFGFLTRFRSFGGAGILPVLGSLNYWGDGSDGSATISSDTDLTSTQDGDMILKQYTDLTIDATYTLSVQNRCKGLFIYVNGDCTINGAISMEGKGANVSPISAGVSATGLRLPLRKSAESDVLASADFAGCGSAVINAVANQSGINGNGKIYQIVRDGATGGASLTSASSPSPGNAGNTIANGSGGGGGGGIWASSGGTSGAGGKGSCFSGGSGGGSCSSSGSTATNGGDYGGAGGNAVGSSGGGAGNPGGTGSPAGSNGTGGLLILMVKGTLTIGASGVINANGVNGAGASEVGGPASGGGVALVIHGGTLSNSGSITATGGSGGSGTYAGGAGGNGVTVTEQVEV